MDNEEKEILLEELIACRSRWTKASKKREPAVELHLQDNEAYEKLRGKLGSEQMMEKVELILTDKEELVGQELELEGKISKQINIIFPQKNNIKVVIPPEYNLFFQIQVPSKQN